MSWYSRYEKESNPLSRVVLTRFRTLPGCGTGYGLKISASTMLNGVVVKPIPSASVTTTRAVWPGVRRRLRTA